MDGIDALKQGAGRILSDGDVVRFGRTPMVHYCVHTKIADQKNIFLSGTFELRVQDFGFGV